MLWIKNFPKTGFGTFCLVFVPALFFCFFLGTNNTFATSYSYTFDSNAQASQILCQYNASGVSSCDDYSYIRFDSNFTTIGSIRVRYSSDTSTNQDCSSSSSLNYSQSFAWSSDIIFKLPHVCSISFGDAYTWSTSSGSLTITLYDSDIFSPSSCPDLPSATLNISENGTYDVSSYAQAVVDIPPETVYGDYHDDLLSIKHSIYVCGAIVLVLYFFYCIYRMIIKSTGGF